jgi:monofunctional biosynthetic peptidoglycan transglycosylase
MKQSIFKRLLKLLLIKIPLAFIVLSVLWVLVLRWVPVWVTPLMISRSIEYRGDDSFQTHKSWQRYENISPELAKAVIASEDNLFVEHHGFDWKEMKKAIDDHQVRGKRLRGASTISQQTAKNVFLWNGRSWVRKGLEAYFTVLIELIWGKERIMEVYLNSIEMGPGIYGAEAVAQAHFGKSASKLTRREAALIAATLPNPLKYSSKNPSKYMRNRQRQITRLMGLVENPHIGC